MPCKVRNNLEKVSFPTSFPHDPAAPCSVYAWIVDSYGLWLNLLQLKSSGAVHWRMIQVFIPSQSFWPAPNWKAHSIDVYTGFAIKIYPSHREAIWILRVSGFLRHASQGCIWRSISYLKWWFSIVMLVYCWVRPSCLPILYLPRGEKPMKQVGRNVQKVVDYVVTSPGHCTMRNSRANFKISSKRSERPVKPVASSRKSTTVAVGKPLGKRWTQTKVSPAKLTIAMMSRKTRPERI